MSLITAVGIFSTAMIAPGQTATGSARNAIDTGNQVWIDGIKTGDFKRIAATYSDDAVDCSPTGVCIRGRLQIERQMRAELVGFGRARSAAVRTWGATEQGDFVYEWGEAEASFDAGKRLVERYLTVWRKQADGRWKIFRNMVIPDK